MTSDSLYIITIVGPESSGKSTLATELSMNFGWPCVEEYARAYLGRLGRDYGMSDLEHIARGQWQALETMKSGVLELEAQQPIENEGELKRRLEQINRKDVRYLSFEMKPYAFGQPIVVEDSGLLSLRLWARLKYNSPISFIEDYMVKEATSMYLLCRPVLPWVHDPLREAPVLLDRAWIYNHYLAEIIRLQRL